MKTCTHHDKTDPTYCEYVAPEIYMHNKDNLRCRDYENLKETEGSLT
ncbi:MAG: hypothetical protein FWH37_07145 [Candidatus Bathyarchaeota archaeon]|nr:hypothetical protein [Candidatus Termiticorpusculum sp.]